MRPEPQHGTTGRYSSQKYKCRCTECRKAWHIWFKSYRDRKKVQGICQECAQPPEPGRLRCRLHLDIKRDAANRSITKKRAETLRRGRRYCAGYPSTGVQEPSIGSLLDSGVEFQRHSGRKKRPSHE